MSNNMITCPNCSHTFPVSEGFLSNLKAETSKELENQLRERIKSEQSTDIADLKEIIEKQGQQISDFKKNEIDFRKKTRELEDKEKDIELETQRKIDLEKKQIEEAAEKRYADAHYMKDKEKDKEMNDMRVLIEELKRKSQQHSMQTQGEVAELDLEETLKILYPNDEITEVKKGEVGGDVRQRVKTIKGTTCGLILWERKRTKAWQEDWIKKLKEDMRRDGAQIGIIVTESLPKDEKKDISERNGIWVVTRNFVEPIAMLLRKNLYDIAKNKAIKLNKQGTAEELYDFVTSQEFTRQIERMADIYLEMRSQITKEKIALEKLWKQREMQVDELLRDVSGIYGGMQIIAGTALPMVKNLELQENLE